MKRIGLILIMMFLVTMVVGAWAEDKIELLGGFSMDEAVELTDDQFGRQIVGIYDNKGLAAKDAQLEGWYAFSAPETGVCTIRAKAYKGLVTNFRLLNSDGQRMEKEYFEPNEGWKSYTLNVMKGEKYYLSFERGVDLTWACTFSVCAGDKHKIGTVEATLLEPTCTQTGTIGYRCELCGESIVSGIIPAKGHQPGVERILQEADCLQKGKKGVLCSVCNDVISSVEIPMQGHTPDIFVDVLGATCTAGGIRVQYCKVCKATLNTEKVEAYGHRPGEWCKTQMETCAQAGMREKKCEACGVILAMEEVPKTEHQYSGWKVLQNPTKDVEGEQARICSKCGDIQTERIPKIEKFLGVF